MTTPTVGKRSNQQNPQASHFRLSSRAMTCSVSPQNVVTATVAISREANRMRGLESLPSIVRQDDPEKVLGAGAEPERDEGMIAERRGQREAADLRGSVEDGHPVQIERLPGLDELPLPDL